jgi:flagellar assembly protein FliH
LSNLLKQRPELGVAPFGFPVIESEQGGGKSEDGQELDTLFSEPEAECEDTLRKKLLELERRTNEIEKDAYARGFAQGERDGLEYGRKTVQVIKTQLEGIAANLEALPEKIFTDYREWFIMTCTKVARRIVHKELAISPEIIAGTINALLDEAEEHSTLVVYLHPLDVEFMEKRADLVLASHGKRLEIRPDASLERGGCRVESDVQLLDASIDAQFEEMEKHLLGGLGLEKED